MMESINNATESIMKISADMNLDELAERMGDATEQQAMHMRELLTASGSYSNTRDVPDHEWFALLCKAIVAQSTID